MLPFNSIQSSSDSSASESSSFFKNNRLSLNGLFGEVTEIDEQMPSTITIHPSPPSGSYPFARNYFTSPSKSPSNAMLGGHQSVLLSDLADSNSNTNFQQNILCSYVSDYDNRRCTHPPVNNEFCQKHAEVSQISSTGFLKYQRNDEMPCNNKTVDGTKLSQFSIPTTTTLQQPSEVLEKHLSCTSSLPTKAVIMDESAPNNKLQTAKKTPVVNSQPTPINSEVLRTVVDMLNRNRSGLTTKQQIKLLNSLGVIVATVKNPAELHGGNIPPASAQPTHNAGVHQGNMQMNQQMYSEKPQLQGFSAAPTVKSVNPSKLKRKSAATENFLLNKKSKKMSTEEKTSLQHLTSVELDERVSEALASVGGLSNHHKHTVTRAVTEKPKKKPTVEKKPKKVSSRLTISSSSLPMFSNPQFIHGITSFKAACPDLNSYIAMMKQSIVDKHDMFSLGPFCDDKTLSVCTCTQAQYKLQTPKTKRKTPKVVSKHKQCCQCRIRSLATNTDMWNIPFSSKTKLLQSCEEFQLKNRSDEYQHLKRTNQAQTSSSVKHDCDPSCTDQVTVSNAENCILSTSGSFSEEIFPSEISVFTQKEESAPSLNKNWLKKYKKTLKKQLVNEKKALQLLCGAAKDDTKTTAKALRHLGTDIVGCKPFKQPVLTPKCMLAGRQCNKKPLPLTCYCSEHIWHCQEQQLFKLGADMKVVPDVFPDPVMLKPRKRTKLPALGKRKKRKMRKSAALTRLQAKNEFMLENSVNHLPDTQHPQVKVENDGILSSFVNVEECDEEKLDADKKPCDVSSVSVDEGVLDAFNIEDANFMNDIMPDLLQDFGLFTGKIGDVLDNTLLLGSGIESEYTGQVTSNVSDSNLLYSQTNIDKLTSPLKVGTGVSTLETGRLLGQCSTNVTASGLHLTNSNNTPSSSTEFVSSGSVSTPDEYMSSQTTWSQPMSSISYDGSYSQSVEDIGNISSSTDPFSEDLREIEGVLQSLREEVTGDKCDNSPICPKDMDADEYTSILAKEISECAENQVTSKSGLLKQQTDINFTKSTNFVQQSGCNLISTTCDTGAQTSLNRFQIDPSVEPTNQFIELSTTKKTRKSPSKKSKNVSKANIKSPDGTNENVLQSQDENVARNNKLIPQTNSSIIKLPSNNWGTVVQTIHNPVAETAKGRHGRKGKHPNVVPSYITSGMSSVIAQPCRMQPNILAGNVVCSHGVTTTPANPSMFLIPVNAIVQSGSSGNVTATPNQVGLALAMPSGQTCIPANFGTVIPVRGSTVMQGAGMPQQFIIVNGNQLNHPVSIRTNKRQKTTNKKQTLPTNVATNPTKSSMNSESKPYELASSSTVVPTNSRSTVNILPSPSDTSTKWNKPKRSSPLVIPPVISTTLSSAEVVDAKLSSSFTASNHKSIREKKSGKCGTVHWNQSTVTADTAPPLPQTRVYGEAGGQTSNMLYCRRISPSLNSSHQVTVGRLGSLGHVGVSRLAVNERLNQYQKQHKFAQSQAKNGSERVNVSDELEKKTKSSLALGFINIAESCKQPVAEISNRTGTEVPGSTNKLSPVLESKSETIVSVAPSVKRNSRKSEHKETLRDPDFCEILPETTSSNANSEKDSQISVPD